MFARLTLVLGAVALASAAALADPSPTAPPIILAAFKGDAAAVKQLLAAGVSADTRDDSKFAALNWAAAAGRLEAMKVLVEAGADINAHTNAAGWTPLMNAAGFDHPAAALYLVEKGADVMPIDRDGHSALSYAAEEGEVEVVKALIIRGSDSAVALSSNVREDHPKALRLLVENGANVNARAPAGPWLMAGDTALLAAARDNKAESVAVLLTLGADPNLSSIESSMMSTPLMWAAYHCNGEMARALVARGAAPGAGNANDETAADLARRGWTSDMHACSADVIAALGG